MGALRPEAMRCESRGLGAPPSAQQGIEVLLELAGAQEFLDPLPPDLASHQPEKRGDVHAALEQSFKVRPVGDRSEEIRDLLALGRRWDDASLCAVGPAQWNRSGIRTGTGISEWGFHAASLGQLDRRSPPAISGRIIPFVSCFAQDDNAP